MAIGCAAAVTGGHGTAQIHHTHRGCDPRPYRRGDRMTTREVRAYNVLLIYPRFAADTFWNYAATCELFGARYPAAPLGLITVAALLPSTWSARLVDRNTEDLSDDDLEWADLVMT